MDRIKVEIIHLPPEPILVNAVKKPYLHLKANEKTAHKVIDQLKHESVAEHIHINFNLSGFSRMVLQELARHRMTEFDIDNCFSSMTAQSTRYTLDKMLKLSSKELRIEDFFVIPNLSPQFKAIQEISIINAIEGMIGLYINGHTNDKIKYLLPESFRTEIAWTINIRSLRNFMRLRTARNVHFEMKFLAEKIKESLQDTYVVKYIDFK